MRATFFHVYYIVRYYFDEKQTKDEEIECNGSIFYADIYSYCHILTRHYYPTMNEGLNISLNDNLSILSLRELPSGILKLVKAYCKYKKITKSDEYLLFFLDSQRYIMWIKYDSILNTSKKGFEIRSFYKCEVDRDLIKFVNKRIISINEHISIAI